MKWKVTKHENSDIIEKAILFFGKKSTGEVLFHGAMNPISKRPAAYRIFGERIRAYWDGLDYKVELKNLQFNDTVSFTLLVTQTLDNRLEQRGNPMLKTVTITRVDGMKICLCFRSLIIIFFAFRWFFVRNIVTLHYFLKVDLVLTQFLVCLKF